MSKWPQLGKLDLGHPVVAAFLDPFEKSDSFSLWSKLSVELFVLWMLQHQEM